MPSAVYSSKERRNPQSLPLLPLLPPSQSMVLVWGAGTHLSGTALSSLTLEQSDAFFKLTEMVIFPAATTFLKTCPAKWNPAASGDFLGWTQSIFTNQSLKCQQIQLWHLNHNCPVNSRSNVELLLAYQNECLHQCQRSRQYFAGHLRYSLSRTSSIWASPLPCY